MPFDLFSVIDGIKSGDNAFTKDKKPPKPTKRVTKKPAADATRKAPAKASSTTASKPRPAAKASVNLSSTAQKPTWRPAGVAPATPRSPLPRSPAPVQRAAGLLHLAPVLAPSVDSSRPSGRKTPAGAHAAAPDRCGNRLPPPPATTVHPLPTRPPTPVRNSTNNTHQPLQAGRRQRRPLYDYVDTGEAELREDRTGIEYGYGLQTPHEPPKAKLPPMSPAGPDWKPVSFKPVYPKPEQTRRPMWSSYGVAVELATNKQYTIPLDNTIPAKSDKNARPNRYGARWIVGTREKPVDSRHRTERADGTLVFKADDDLPEGYAWATEQPRSAPVRESSTDRWAFTGEEKSDPTSWRVSDDSIWRGERFKYAVDHAEVVPIVPIVPIAPTVLTDKAPRRTDGEIDVDKILEDCWKPHPLEVKQAEARKQAELKEQARRPEQDNSRTAPSVSKVSHYQRPTHLPIRFRHGDTWQSLSLSELQDEAQIRGLPLHKDDDKPCLAEVMAINDRVFSECWYGLEYRRLNVEQLRDGAIIKGAPLDSQKYYNAMELLSAISSKVSRDSVEQHNLELREKEIAEAEALKERSRRKAREERARKTREADEEKAVTNRRIEPKRKDSHASEPSAISTPQADKMNGTKGKKRARSDNQDTDEPTPKKKPKASPPDEDNDAMQVDDEAKPTPSPKAHQTTKKKSPLPRAMQAQAKKATSNADVEMSDDRDTTPGTPKATEEVIPKNPLTHSRHTRNNKRDEKLMELKDEEDVEMNDEEEMDLDDFVVHDGPKPKHRPKSAFGDMVRSGLVSGMK